ncbi:MAG: hydroxysqualene dehydroxylase HpnE [Burkholderiales bacterium]
MSRRVAIIGAGWTGLAAAVALVGEGAAVEVFEASRHLGGRARRVMVEGLELDNGQHILIGAYAEALRLMRVVGVDAEHAFLRLPLELRSASGFRLRAARLPPPFHLLVGLLRAEGVGLGDRIATARLVAAHRRRSYRLRQDETVQAWLERQPEMVRTALWEPLCTAALNTPVARASAQVFLNVLRDTIEGDRGASDLLLPRIDLTALFPEPAAGYVTSRGGAVHLGAAIRRIERAPQGFRVDGHEHFTHVIVACASQHAGGLIAGFTGLGSLANRLERIDHEPIYTCYLQYPEPIALPFPMLGLRGGLAQWAFDRGSLSGHRGLIACVLSGSGAHESLAQEELAAALHVELSHALPGLPAPRWTRVIAERRATFSCRVGLDRPPNATPIPNLLLAGDYTASEYPATLEAAVRSGVAAARLASG